MWSCSRVKWTQAFNYANDAVRLFIRSISYVFTNFYVDGHEFLIIVSIH